MRRGTQKNKCRLQATGCRLQDHSGFSFIEVMLSVFLLSAGMVAAVSLIGGGMKESIDSRNQIIASLLAQEGIELVRNIRDNNWVQSPPPPGLSFDSINNGTWKIDVLSNSLAAVGGSATLNYDNVNHRYAHSGGNPTKFSREIFVSDGAANEKVVISLVTWNGSAVFPAVNNCATNTKCSYVQATLTAWSE